jgi:hypothetical protein
MQIKLLSLLLLMLAWTEVSLAQEREAARPETVAGQLSFPDPRLRRLHGLYVRGGLGFGGMGNNVIALDKDEGEERSEGTVTGMGLTSELSIGGTVGENWVLGGGIYNTYVFASNYTQIEGAAIPRGLQRPENATLVGLMADWRFAPHLGLHAQGALGVAGLSSQKIRDGELDGSTVALGPGLTLGLGADFWLDPSWAVGVIARFTAMAVFESEAGKDYVHGVACPGMLFTVAYND